MRESEFLEDFQLVAGAATDSGGRVLAYSVHGEDGRLIEGRRIKGAGRVRLVMLREENCAVAAQFGQMLANGFAQVEFLAKPGGQPLQERLETKRRHGKISL